MAQERKAKGGRRRSGASSGAGIQSVARALGILELFNERRAALTASEIANLTELNRATTYRFCQTLLRLGYLEETGERKLRPGLKAITLAQAALSSRELPELAFPYLRDLQASTGETVNMALLDDVEVVYVARLLSDHLLTLRLFVGSRLPAHSTSLGRAILAFLPEERIEDILKRSDLKAITDHTITDRERLIAELKRIRRRGYAVNDQELVNGLWGCAAPVFGVSGDPIAAINVSIPHPIEPGDLESKIAPAVVKTGKSVTALASRLGLDAV